MPDTPVVKISCRVNGAPIELRGHPMERLLDTLRSQVRLTGTKEGCGEGECGACAVLLDGELVNSCLVPACQADGCEIRTVEGLASASGALHPIQQAFWERGGAQCGICTPWMLMASAALLAANPRPGEAEIREGLAGNLCRCTGYVKIVESVAVAARARAPRARGAAGSARRKAR
jgi:carbon-monoxide dehydrogenase small subunit